MPNRLTDFIQEEYGLVPTSIVPAKRGFFGETWRLNTSDRAYFVKLHYSDPYKTLYENSFHVIEHLRNHGIDFVGTVVKTSRGGLCARFGAAVLGVFEWIDGELLENDDTKIPEYEMLAKVYAVDGKNLSMPREDFSAKSAELFFERRARLKAEHDTESATEALALLLENGDEHARLAKRLALLSEICAKDRSGFVITHGDAGGNFMVGGDKNYIIDWDTPMFAAPERDAWVMMHREWAMEAFQGALIRNGIDYKLRPERLAYYCYHMYFYYLNAFLDGLKRPEIVRELGDYLEGWMTERRAFADRLIQ